MQPSPLNRSIRQILVQEIDRWQKEGLIPAGLAGTLRKRYDFDFPSPVPVAAPAAPPVPSAVPPAPKPHLTLTQTLLSETSIRIYLYLGAFFVISAAMILAVLVAGLRLPILVAVTLLFGLGALLLKKRLPQPSFILYLVFSALLPITAGVLADLLNLFGKAESGYWLGVLGGMALVWAVSSWLYASRFFSLTALLALDAAAVMAGRLADRPHVILYLLLLTLSGLAGLGGAFLLKRWRGRRMAMPLYILLQVQQGLILGALGILLLFTAFTSTFEWELQTSAAWFLAGAFFILSDLLFPFILFPWIAAAAFMPLAWQAFIRPSTAADVSAVIQSGWGAILAIAGTGLLLLRNRARSYALPLGIAALPLLLLGAGLGLHEDIGVGFGLFLGAAILLSILHALRRRAWLWTVDIGFALAAYLTFFHLPGLAILADHASAQLAGATFLLLLPDMLLPASRPLPAWRWPLRGWAIATGLSALFSGLLIHFTGTIDQVRVNLFALGLLGLVYLAYALRKRLPWLGGSFTLHLTLALTFGLSAYSVDAWLPFLAGLAVLFYASGVLLRRQKQTTWSLLMRVSGLVLAGILSLAAFGYNGHDRSIYAAILAGLFLVETTRTVWLETLAPVVFSLALCMALSDGKVEEAAYFTAGIAVLFLGLDLFYTRLKNRPTVRWITRTLGGLAAALTPILVVLPELKQTAGTITCAVLAGIFVVQALVYRRSFPGYFATTFLALAVLFTDLRFVRDRWLWPLTITAGLFYAASFLRGPFRRSGWEAVFRYSGLGLVTLTAFSAPFERSGLIASLPVAIAASLWAVEAFRLRSVWLGFPANLLYLTTYFMILGELRVDQPQFFSVGAAVLGLLMHYLLVRAGSRTGAFLTGMFSQLVLLSTTYIQMTGTKNIWYFAVLFFQALAVLGYGIVTRSRSLVITPIIMLVLGVVTVVFGILHNISTVILIGCTGIGLILAGIAALLLRERIAGLRDQLKGWRA